ncbi:MAG: hypothetical protein QM754_20675 [Tepidisphaeraceae bacterium]
MAALNPDTLARTLRRWRRALRVARLADALWLAIVIGGTTAVLLHALRVSSAGPMVAGMTVAAFAFGFRRAPRLGEVAAELDRRFSLDDLLATAWATRGPTQTDWQATLSQLAAARAVTLPGPGWLGRRSARQHVCAVTALVALAIAVQLLPAPAVSAPALADANTARPAAGQTVTADVRQRAPDTADEATNLPVPAPADESSASADSSRPVRPNAAAQSTPGAGRADAAKPAVVPGRSTPAAPATPTSPGPAGSGTAGRRNNAAGESDGHVAEDKPLAPTAVTGNPSKSSHTSAETPATEIPPAYRGMVKEFFER